MTEKTEIAASKIDAAMGSVINKLTALVERHSSDALDLGGKAVELGLRVVQMDSFFTVLAGWVMVLFATAGITFGLCALRKCSYYNDKGDHYDSDKEFGWGTGGIISCLMGVICLIISFFYIFNFWAYVGIVDPKLYLAHKVVQSIL